MNKVGIIMGSKSDMDVAVECIRILKDFDVECDVIVASAHRTPEKTSAWSKAAKENNYACIIAFAGAAAHLAGVVASETNVPVIAVPISATSLAGIDALYSMVQMPGGIPVAVMAIGKAGARNAAVFAAQLIGITNPDMYEKLEQFRENMRTRIEKDNEDIRKLLNEI